MAKLPPGIKYLRSVGALSEPKPGPPEPVKFAPCRKGQHGFCAMAYFDDCGAKVRCSCTCHPSPHQPTMFDVAPNAKPSTSQRLVESVQPDLFRRRTP